MRIISGKDAGRKISSPNKETRPTLDRVKESLFNIIRDKIPGSVALDLFGGSGAIGLEFLSRGGAFVYLCEKDAQNYSVIRKSIDALSYRDQVKLSKSDFRSFLSKIATQFDLVYIDPPYEEGLEYIALKQLIEYNLLKEEALIIVETTGVLDPVDGYEVIDERKYGKIFLTFLKEV